MHTSKSVKNTAKSLLSQNWSKAYAAMAIILMASLCIYLAERLVDSLLSDFGFINKISFSDNSSGSLSALSNEIVNVVMSEGFIYSIIISLFFLLLRLIVVSPIEQGHVKWYYSIAKGSKTYLSKLFFYYQSNNAFISLLIFKIGQAVRRIIYGAISFIAPIAALSLSIYQLSVYSMSGLASDRQKALLYIIATLFLFVLGIIMYILLMLKFFLANYLFVSINDFDKGIKRVNACFARSKEMMNGNSGRVIALAVSFIPAILSCVFIFPILYVYPYIRCSLATLARYIIKEAREAEAK